MEHSGEEKTRVPLSVVVAECVKRWFQDTLKQAKSGDVTMQFLVGQMYYSGYGVPVNPFEGRAWTAIASRCQSSDTNLGCNASDFDSGKEKKLKGEEK